MCRSMEWILAVINGHFIDFILTVYVPCGSVFCFVFMNGITRTWGSANDLESPISFLFSDVTVTSIQHQRGVVAHHLFLPGFPPRPSRDLLSPHVVHMYIPAVTCLAWNTPVLARLLTCLHLSTVLSVPTVFPASIVMWPIIPHTCCTYVDTRLSLPSLKYTVVARLLTFLHLSTDLNLFSLSLSVELPGIGP